MATATDVIVLGVGTCGEDAALRLLDAGLEVVGVEANLIGGECPYWACLPTKTMVRTSNLLKETQRANQFVGDVSVDPDWNLLAGRVRSNVTGNWNDSGAADRFEKKGGRLVRGRGVLTSKSTVSANDTEFEARRGIVIATGSSPVTPPITGLEDVDYWTTHDAIAATELPGSLLVLGGGAVGCELGQVFARFGVDVTIVEFAPRILPSEEPEVSDSVAAAFGAESIRLLTGRRVEALRQEEASIFALLDDGNEVAADKLLVATGRKVVTSGLGLDNAGINTTDRGTIQVDQHLRAAPGIWSIGDVTGVGMFTHVALYQGSIAVQDILGHNPPPADYTAIPRATFTDPEVGSVGVTEVQAAAADLEISVVTKQLGATFRGWLHGPGGSGVIKLVVDKKGGVLIGASVVGPHAGEVLGMLSLAVRSRVPVSQMVDMIYAFPTFYGGVGEALGAYGRGVTRVLDPDTPPMFTDTSV